MNGSLSEVRPAVVGGNGFGTGSSIPVNGSLLDASYSVDLYPQKNIIYTIERNAASSKSTANV